MAEAPKVTVEIEWPIIIRQALAMASRESWFDAGQRDIILALENRIAAAEEWAAECEEFGCHDDGTGQP
jgi:hypothetical protein